MLLTIKFTPLSTDVQIACTHNIHPRALNYNLCLIRSNVVKLSIHKRDRYTCI